MALGTIMAALPIIGAGREPWASRPAPVWSARASRVAIALGRPDRVVLSVLSEEEVQPTDERDSIRPSGSPVQLPAHSAASALDEAESQRRGGTTVAVSEEESRRPAELVGTWRKITTSECAEKYPATISFSTGTYRGARGPGQGMVWWDAGIYRVEGPRRLVLSVATDELVTYEIALGEDELDIVDAEGCRFSYRREPKRG